MSQLPRITDFSDHLLGPSSQYYSNHVFLNTSSTFKDLLKNYSYKLISHWRSGDSTFEVIIGGIDGQRIVFRSHLVSYIYRRSSPCDYWHQQPTLATTSIMQSRLKYHTNSVIKNSR